MRKILIRSQFRDILVNTNSIIVKSGGIYTEECAAFNGYITLGYYEDSIRATEILDEIQAFQEDLEMLKLRFLTKEEFLSKHESLIYKIPEK